MIVNTLPPQAYTKETLQKAYTWLLNQTPSVKDLATNQEVLVSLYLRAVRNGEVSVDTPSIQNFKQELKSLATLMGDLQTPTAKAPAPAPAPVAQKPAPVAPAVPVAAQAAAPPASSSQGHLADQLDEQSWMAIHEVRLMLNLGSDTEALRALISMGHKQFKKM